MWEPKAGRVSACATAAQFAWLQVLYNQPSLDMSLTRMSDSKHDHQVIHALFDNSNRMQRRSLASSIGARTRSKPSVMASVVGAQLKEKGAQLSVDASHLCRAGQFKICEAVSTSIQAQSIEATVPHEACGQTYANSAATESAGIIQFITTERRINNLIATDFGCQDTCCTHTQPPVHAEALVVACLGAKDQAGCGLAKEFNCQEHAFAECPLTQSREQSDDPRAMDRVIALLDKPMATGLQPRWHMPLAALPSQIHRKLEAMSARNLAKPTKSQEQDSNS